MRIKVRLNWLSGAALKRELREVIYKQVREEVPAVHRYAAVNLEKREERYKELCKIAYAEVDFIKERSYAVFEFDFETKVAKLVELSDE